MGIPDPLGTLALESFRLHRELAPVLKQETGTDTEFQLHTHTTVAFSEEEVEQLRALLPWQQAQPGFSVEWKSRKDILALEPRLAPQIAGGVVTRSVGLLDPYKYCLALLKATEKRGATFRHGRVIGLRFDDQRLTGVRLADEELPCVAVVIAMGPWTAHAGPWLGIEPPVSPLKGQILRLRASGPPLIYVSWANSYAVTKPDGLVWVGTTEEDVGFNKAPSAEARQRIMESVLGALPALADAEVVQQTACLRPVTADGLPILGQVPDKQGVVVATGGGRKGILLSTLMGSIAADLMLRGATDYDITALLPGRRISAAQAALARTDPFRF